MAKLKRFYFKLNLNMLLFCLGIIAGTAAINCFYVYYDNTFFELINTYFGSVGTYSTYGEIFLGVFIRRILLAAIIIGVFEVFNNIWIVYLLLSSLGMAAGIMMTVLSMNMGIKSIGAFILICFPHIFIYAFAVYILTRIKFSGYYTMKLKESYTGIGINSFDKRKGCILAVIIFVLGIFAEALNALYILPEVFAAFT